MNQFGLIQTADLLRQRTIVAVATAINRRLDTYLGQSLALANADVLRASVGVVYQRSIAALLPCIKSLIKCIQNEVCNHRRTDPPADGVPGEHVDHKGHIKPTLPRRNVDEVRNPELVWPRCSKLPAPPILQARGFRIGNDRVSTLASHRAVQTQLLHQPVDGAASHRNTLRVHLLPDYIRIVDPYVDLPDTLDFGPQTFSRIARTQCCDGSRSCAAWHQ